MQERIRNRHISHSDLNIKISGPLFRGELKLVAGGTDIRTPARDIKLTGANPIHTAGQSG